MFPSETASDSFCIVFRLNRSTRKATSKKQKLVLLEKLDDGGAGTVGALLDLFNRSQFIASRHRPIFLLNTTEAALLAVLPAVLVIYIYFSFLATDTSKAGMTIVRCFVAQTISSIVAAFLE